MRLWAFILIFIFCASLSYAQDLEGYEPPALFDAKPQVNPENKIKRDRLPGISKPAEESKTQIKIKKTQSLQIEKPPKPKIKPKAPTKLATQPSSHGVVKGPKTMPAIKKQSVETEVLYESNQKPSKIVNPAPVIKKETKKATPEKETSKTEIDKTLPKTFKLEFKDSADVITDAHRKIVMNIAIPQLHANKKTRLIVQSYAPLKSKGLTVGRRIALSRAINLRQFIIEQEINPNIIDVRAMPADSNPDLANKIQVKIIE
jgi:hypothetical protein